MGFLTGRKTAQKTDKTPPSGQAKPHDTISANPNTAFQGASPTASPLLSADGILSLQTAYGNTVANRLIQQSRQAMDSDGSGDSPAILQRETGGGVAVSPSPSGGSGGLPPDDRKPSEFREHRIDSWFTPEQMKNMPMASQSDFQQREMVRIKRLREIAELAELGLLDGDEEDVPQTVYVLSDIIKEARGLKYETSIYEISKDRIDQLTKKAETTRPPREYSGLHFNTVRMVNDALANYRTVRSNFHKRILREIIKKDEDKPLPAPFPQFQSEFSRWLTKRIPNLDPKDEWELVKQFNNIEILEKTIKAFQGNEQAAQNHWRTNQQIGRGVDQKLLKSETIGQFLVEPYKQGKKVEGSVIALDEAEFAEAHFQETLAKNPKVEDVGALRIIDSLKVDGTVAFAKTTGNREIVVRKGRVNNHVLIHESIHKFGSDSFHDCFGHILNEAVTETLAIEVCKETHDAYSLDYYPQERNLLGLIMKHLKINLDMIRTCYFTGNQGPLIELMMTHIGEGAYQAFIREKNVSKAQKIFFGGVEEVNPIHHLAETGNVVALEKLVKKKIDLNMVNPLGYTALHLAANKGHADIIRVLINAGAGVNLQSPSGLTPFYLACVKADPLCVQYFLQAGMDPTAPFHDGKFPLEICINKGFNLKTVMMLGAKYKQVKQSTFSRMTTDVPICHEKNEKSGSLVLSGANTAYYLSEDSTWYKVFYVVNETAGATMYIKKSGIVSVT